MNSSMELSEEGSSSIGELMNRALSGELSFKTIPNYNDRGMKLPIEPNMPWSTEGIPMSIGCDMNMLRVKASPTKDGSGDSSYLQLMVPGHEDRDLSFNKEGLRLLGHHVGFKVDFIEKLPINLRAEVINEMVRQHRSQTIQLSGNNSQISQLSPGWRHLCSHAEIAQLSYNTMKGISGNVDVHSYSVSEGYMMLKLSTQRIAKVTAKRGDSLAHGLKVVHRPGVDICVSLFTTRLACVNGMESEAEEFSWTNQKSGTLDHQLDFLVKAISNTTSGFSQVISKAKEMATIDVKGDPLEALVTRAKHMKIPTKFTQHLVDAYNAEPGSTEWDMLNALTRFATHSTASGIDEKFRTGVQTSAGSWTSNFDMVHARLPRSIAEFAGAEIFNN